MKAFIPAFTLVIFSLVLTACGGGDDGGNPPATTTPTGSVSLSWDTPATKVDGNSLSLSEIDGYKLYITQDSTTYPTQAYLDIKDNTTSSYTIGGLSSGQYYIYVTTYDMNGDESPLSDPVSTTI